MPEENKSVTFAERIKVREFADQNATAKTQATSSHHNTSRFGHSKESSYGRYDNLSPLRQSGQSFHHVQQAHTAEPSFRTTDLRRKQSPVDARQLQYEREKELEALDKLEAMVPPKKELST